MSAEQKVAQTEDLNKSIDALLDEVFSDEVSKGLGIDLVQDNKKTADAALASVPGSQKDESRGAGRPKQISDVPQNDMDGKRASEYDAGIASASKEDEPEEAKKQSKAIDQVSKEGHMSSGSKSPEVRPFKKSEGGNHVIQVEGQDLEITAEDLKALQEIKKSKAAEAEKAQKVEELKKAEATRKDQEDLIKSAVAQATSKLAKENEDLRKSFKETNDLIKAMAAQPQRAKSITGIDALEKSTAASESKGPESFSKSEILDAAFELVKAGKIKDVVVSEIEMTNRCSDPQARAMIEKHLEGK